MARRVWRTYIIGAAACLVIGLLCGAVWANMMAEEAFRTHLPGIMAYRLGVPQSEGLRVVSAAAEFETWPWAWAEAFVKHARLVATIWVLAFWPRASRVAYAVCGVKGVGVGFVLGLFGRAFGGQGVWQAVMLVGLSCAVMFPAAVLATAVCRAYDDGQAQGQKQARMTMARYVLVGVGLLLAAALAAWLEVFAA